jgi:hypothetical protein
MHARLAVAFLGSTLALAAWPAAAVTPDDCQAWLARLRGEAASAEIAGDDAARHRKALVDGADEASRTGRERRREASEKALARFREQAAELTARGKLTAAEGQRLDTLSEATRRCIAQTPREGAEQ